MKDCILLYYILIKDESDRQMLYDIITEFCVNDNTIRHFVPIYEGITEVKCLNSNFCFSSDGCNINFTRIKNDLDDFIENYKLLGC
jgi:hypothetical protein